MIREAADPALSKAERGALVRALAAVEHVGPGGERVSVGRSTLDDWIRAWRGGGFDALLPRARALGPLTPSRVLAVAEALKRELPARTAGQVHEIMVAAGEPVPSARTLQRHFARLGLGVRADGAAPKVYGRFEALTRERVVDGRRAAWPAGRGPAGGAAGVHRRLQPLVGYRWGTGEDVLRLAAALRPGFPRAGCPTRPWSIVARRS